MLNLSHSQAHAVLAELSRALDAHDAWFQHLTRTLICRLMPDPVDLTPDAHRRCAFGAWYHAYDGPGITGHPTYLTIGREHRAMHEHARRLLDRLAAGADIPVGDFNAFTDAMTHLRREIESLGRELQAGIRDVDPLTGVYTRAGMMTFLQEQHAMVRRGLHTCAIAMFDLDRFKRINDRFGHLAGDAVLAATGRFLMESVRRYDLVYRYGGDEFLLCFPSTDLPSALVLAERLRVELRGLGIAHQTGGDLGVTASIGLAPVEAEHAVEASIRAADAALYQAKEAGRNRVRVWPDALAHVADDPGGPSSG
jgi:diguanylate cyclase (GGDEF)-like protein